MQLGQFGNGLCRRSQAGILREESRFGLAVCQVPNDTETLRCGNRKGDYLWMTVGMLGGFAWWKWQDYFTDESPRCPWWNTIRVSISYKACRSGYIMQRRTRDWPQFLFLGFTAWPEEVLKIKTKRSHLKEKDGISVVARVKLVHRYRPLQVIPSFSGKALCELRTDSR